MERFHSQIKQFIKEQNHVQLEKLLDENPELFNYRNEEGVPLLSSALNCNFKNLALKILKLNPDLNIVDKFNQTALVYAIWKNKELVPLILENPLFTNLNNEFGNFNILTFSIEHFQYRLAKQILLNPNFTLLDNIDKRFSSFIKICEHHKLKDVKEPDIYDEVLEILLKKLNINKLDEKNNSLLYYTIIGKSPRTALKIFNDEKFGDYNIKMGEDTYLTLSIKFNNRDLALQIINDSKFTNYDNIERYMDKLITLNWTDIIKIILNKNPSLFNGSVLIKTLNNYEIFDFIFSNELFRDFNYVDSEKNTILMKAVLLNKKDIITNILSNSNCNNYDYLSCQNKFNMTALMMSLKQSNLEISKLLLNKNQNFNLLDKENDSILIFSIWKLPELFLEIIEKIPEFDINSIHSISKFSYLDFAIKFKRREITSYLVLNPNFKHLISETYSIYINVLSYEWNDIIEQLKIREPKYILCNDLINKDLSLWTLGDYESFNEYLKYKDLTWIMINNSNFNLTNYCNTEGKSLLIIIIQKNTWIDILKELLKKPTLDFTIKDQFDKTCLDYLNKRNSELFIKIIKHPNFNNWNWTSSNGNTLLHRAIKYCHYVVDDIIDNPSFTNWNSVNSKGNTILHHSIKNNYEDMALKILINPLFTNFSHINKSGHSALDLIIKFQEDNDGDQSWDEIKRLLETKQTSIISFLLTKGRIPQIECSICSQYVQINYFICFPCDVKHVCCVECFNQIKKMESPKCPFCRNPISEGQDE